MPSLIKNKACKSTAKSRLNILVNKKRVNRWLLHTYALIMAKMGHKSKFSLNHQTNPI